MLARDILRYCIIREHIGNDQKQFKLGRVIPTTLIRVVVAITFMSILEVVRWWRYNLQYHHIHKKHHGKQQKPPLHDELGVRLGSYWDNRKFRAY